MQYDTLGKCYYGFTDINIRNILHDYIDFFRGYSVLFACLDSTPNTVEFKSWIENMKSNNTHFDCYNNNLWFDKDMAIYQLTKRGTFSGHDEIYLFKDKPLIYYGNLVNYAPEGYRFDGKIPEIFMKQFIGLGAQRYLSDGDGLNYVCEDSATAQIIESLEFNEE